MDHSTQPTPRRLLAGWLVPRKGRRRWALLRLAVVVALLVVLRFHVLAWLVAGHSLAWKTVTGSKRHHPGDVELLLRLREPGARMLLRMGEGHAFARACQPHMLPVLLDLARSHPEPAVRAHALTGLAYYWNPRTLPIAADALDHPHPAVRRAAALAIRRLGDQRHVPLLERRLAAESNPGIQLLLQAAIQAARPAPGQPATAGERTVKVAAVQCVSHLGQVERNRAHLERLVRQAAAHGAKIVVLPETAIPGYLTFDIHTAWQAKGYPITQGLRGVSPDHAAEPVPGPSTQAFATLAKELGIYLTVPLLELDTTSGNYYNTLCLVDPAGKLLLHYRKLNPWPYAERGWAAKGDRGLVHADTPYGRLSLLICFDIHTETPRLTQAGVDILLYSICWVDRPNSPWFHAELPGIARTCNLHIIGANWTVPRKPAWHGYGHSLIIDRTGRVLARARDDLAEEIVYARIPIPH